MFENDYLLAVRRVVKLAAANARRRQLGRSDELFVIHGLPLGEADECLEVDDAAMIT